MLSSLCQKLIPNFFPRYYYQLDLLYYFITPCPFLSTKWWLPGPFVLRWEGHIISSLPLGWVFGSLSSKCLFSLIFYCVRCTHISRFCPLPFMVKTNKLLTEHISFFNISLLLSLLFLFFITNFLLSNFFPQSHKLHYCRMISPNILPLHNLGFHLSNFQYQFPYCPLPDC